MVFGFRGRSGNVLLRERSFPITEPASTESDGSAWMLQLRVLGTLDLRGVPDTSAAALLAQPRPIALLSYLAVERPGAYWRRDHLATMFWPETGQERARTNLRKLVFTIRRIVGSEVLEARGDEDLRLPPEACWCDAAEFRRAMAGNHAAQALALHRGDFLHAFHLTGAPALMDWLDATRRALKRDAVKAGLSLAEEHVRNQERTDVGDLIQSIFAAMADLDDEHLLRKAMLLLEQIGDRGSALRLHEQYERHLRGQFEAEPSIETRRLAERLRQRPAPDR